LNRDVIEENTNKRICQLLRTRVLFCGLITRATGRNETDVLEEHIDNIFRVEEKTKKELQYAANRT
jgi:hypothetical protein